MKPPSGNSDSGVVTGLMSGTSLDGLDIAACHFEEKEERWSYAILAAETIEYPRYWTERLRNAHTLSGQDLTLLDRQFGAYMGEAVTCFNKKHSISPGLVASHGHTIFHRPDLGYTLQLGNGASLAGVSGLPVVCDFRSGDVALGGQGAPLVPVGDRMLFSEYSACLNLGGFSNISFEENGIRKAGDICPVNTVLNYLAQKAGMEYDKDGNLGRMGRVNLTLLDNLGKLEFYHQPLPKSLGREWVEKIILPLLENSKDLIENQLYTFYTHIGIEMGRFLKPGSRVLITGGGAFNPFLIQKIRKNTFAELIIPDPSLVKFKEALIFAFLGLLRWKNMTNCLQSVTGATRDSCAGAVYLP
jgi:anhydro-N-acetylmuramic acid kinase